MNKFSKNIKRVVILTQDYFPEIGGITTWCYELANSFANKGLEVILITKDVLNSVNTKQVNSNNLDLNEHFKVIRLDSHKWKNTRNAKFLNEIEKFAKKFKNKEYKNQEYRNNGFCEETVFLCANWKVATACYLFNLKHPFSKSKISYFVAIHGLDAIEGRFSNRILQRKILNNSNGVICVSNYTKSLLHSKINPSKVSVINNGIDLKKFIKFSEKHKSTNQYNEDILQLINKYNLTNLDTSFVSVGRLVKRKGFDKNILALLDLPEDVHYYLIGDGNFRSELEKLTKDNNLSNRVHFLGYLVDNELYSILSLFKLHSMPCRMIDGWDVEGFGITYLEAAAVGVPSIGGRNSGAEDAIVNNLTGLLVDGNNQIEISNTIKNILFDYKLQNTLKNNSIENVKNYDWDKISQIYIDLFQK